MNGTSMNETSMNERHLVSFTVNEDDHEVVVDARTSLVDVLRHDLDLTGTHVGCEHGICGACTVMMDGAPVRACLVHAVQADGSDISTVEGLADRRGRGESGMCDIQDAFSRHHALQCGFCTPGMLMVAESILDSDRPMGREEIRTEIAANMCRCTGYQTIVDAVDEIKNGE